jgi:hypothetical protein
LGIYLKIDAAAIVAPVAAASGRAQKCHKTGGAGKKFHFHSGFYLKLMLQQSLRQSQLQVEEPKSAIKHGGAGKTFISTWEFT